MAYSYIEYTAGGSATFNIPFEYINQSEIEVFVDGTAATFTFTSANTVNVTPTPTSGATVRIERTTDLTNRAVDFASGSVLTEEDLDNSNIQVYHAAQEAIDKAEAALSLDADGKFDGEVGGTNRVIKNVADPVNAQDVTTKNWVENTWLSPSDKAQLNAIDTTKLHTVANDIANVNTTAGSIANVNTTAGAISNVNTVAGSIANVNTTATNITDVNTVATNIGDINTVENSIANVNTTATNIADVNTVATNIGDINTVEDSIANVNKVGTDIANVNTTAGSIANVNTVATNVADVNTTAGAIANVNAVGGNIANVNAVAGNATNINAVQANETNINAVNANSGNINTVAGNNTNVTTVANNIADVSLAATNISDIQTIATEVAKVVTVANDLNEATSEIDVVAASIANVDAVGNDIANVNTVATNLTSVNAFADTYFISATAPSSPTEGDLWFDTANDLMMVYNGGSWQNAGSSVNGTAARFKFVATASQTAFTGADANGATLAYDSGYIDVYLNGVHLDPSDYTATDGSTITLASGAAAGDELYVVAFGTFTLATHYTKTESDAKFYNKTELDGGQLDNRYYTETEVDGLLGSIDATNLKDSSDNVVVDASSGNMVLGDNKKAIFGAGSDLQIFHDGSNSYVADKGTGNLVLQADASFKLENSDATKTSIFAQPAGAVQLKYDNATKLATSSTGINVTGTMSSGNVGIDKSGSPIRSLQVNNTSSSSSEMALTSSSASGTGFINVCDQNGNNGANYAFTIRGLTSNGSAPATLSSCTIDATTIYGKDQRPVLLDTSSLRGSNTNYQRFSSGLIIQYGYAYVNANATATVAYPLTFPTAVRAAFSHHGEGGLWNSGTSWSTMGGVYPINNSQLQIYNKDDSGVYYYWMALGH